jgi:hypothetical protein
VSDVRPLSVTPALEVSVYAPEELLNRRDWDWTLAEMLMAPTSVPVKLGVAVAEFGMTAGVQSAAVFQSLPGPIQICADDEAEASARQILTANRVTNRRIFILPERLDLLSRP